MTSSLPFLPPPARPERLRRERLMKEAVQAYSVVGPRERTWLREAHSLIDVLERTLREARASLTSLDMQLEDAALKCLNQETEIRQLREALRNLIAAVERWRDRPQVAVAGRGSLGGALDEARAALGEKP